VALGQTLRAGALLLAVAICAASGCGLPDARPDIPPPTDADSSQTGRQFTFRVPESTVAPFRGVEVYYRFAEVGTVLDRFLESNTDLLEQRFRRLASSNDRYPSPTLPLIDQPGADVVVTVDFSGVTFGMDPVVTYLDRDGNARRLSLRRAVDQSDGQYDRFACEEFDSDDDDVDGVVEELADTEDCEQVQLQLYALSYGRTDVFTVYSDALHLGAIDLTFGRP